MAGHGPPPADRKRRRNADPDPDTVVSHDDELRGFELPEGVLPGDEEWHPRTLAWWSTWRRSPQAKTFIATDWDALLDTALLHHVMWTKGRWEFAGEVRLRAAKFGATPEDRMRLKMKVDLPGAEPVSAPMPSGNVTSIRSRRERLTG
jgi:hypothetical protein